MKILTFIGGMLAGAWLTAFLIAFWYHFPSWSGALFIASIFVCFLCAVSLVIDND